MLAALVGLVWIPPSQAAECYVGLGGGRFSLGKSYRHEADKALASSKYVSGTYSETAKSSVVELQFGCELRYGLKIELGLIEGIRATARVVGTATYRENSVDFDVDAVLRARGYMASLVTEARLSQRTLGFLRLGAIYVQATGDVYPYGSTYSIHAEKKAWIPVAGAGVRAELDNRWSGAVEYRLFGTPKVSEVAGMLQYAFH